MFVFLASIYFSVIIVTNLQFLIIDQLDGEYKSPDLVSLNHIPIINLDMLQALKACCERKQPLLRLDSHSFSRKSNFWKRFRLARGEHVVKSTDFTTCSPSFLAFLKHSSHFVKTPKAGLLLAFRGMSGFWFIVLIFRSLRKRRRAYPRTTELTLSQG